MPNVYQIAGQVADKYHGCGYALAAVASGKIVDLVYVHDVIEDFDDEGDESLRDVIGDDRLGPTVRYLSALGDVSVGMCSCYEFVEL